MKLQINEDSELGGRREFREVLLYYLVCFVIRNGSLETDILSAPTPSSLQ